MIPHNKNERDKAMVTITIIPKNAVEEIEIFLTCNNEDFLKKKEHGEMVPVSVACGMSAHVETAIGKSNE